MHSRGSDDIRQLSLSGRRPSIGQRVAAEHVEWHTELNGRCWVACGLLLQIGGCGGDAGGAVADAVEPGDVSSVADLADVVEVVDSQESGDLPCCSDVLGRGSDWSAWGSASECIEGALPKSWLTISAVDGLIQATTVKCVVPDDAEELSIHWAFGSNLTTELCGTGPGDSTFWQASVAAIDGSEQISSRCSHTDTCAYDVGYCLPTPCAPPSDCGCGRCYSAAAQDLYGVCNGSDARSIDDDGQITNLDVSSVAGKPVLLSFSVVPGYLNADAILSILSLGISVGEGSASCR